MQTSFAVTVCCMMFFRVCANTQSSSSLGTALSLKSDLCWWTLLESQCVVLLEMHSLQVPAGDPNPGRVMDFLSVVIAFRWPVIWLAQWGGRWGWVGGEGWYCTLRWRAPATFSDLLFPQGSRPVTQCTTAKKPNSKDLNTLILLFHSSGAKYWPNVDLWFT